MTSKIIKIHYRNGLKITMTTPVSVIILVVYCESILLLTLNPFFFSQHYIFGDVGIWISACFFKIIVSCEDFFKNALGISLLSNSCLSAPFKGQHRQSNMHLKCHSYIYRWDGSEGIAQPLSWPLLVTVPTNTKIPAPSRNTHQKNLSIFYWLKTENSLLTHVGFHCLIVSRCGFTHLKDVSTMLMELLQVVFTIAGVTLLSYIVI